MSVNQLCDADHRVGHNEHKHKCNSCGTVWKHNEDDVQQSDATFDEGHQCPRCGDEQRMKFTANRQEERDLIFAALMRAFG